MARLSNSGLNLNCKTKFNPISCNKLRILHSLITISTIALYLLYLLVFDGLLNIGIPTQSPIIGLVVVAEFVKFFVNEKYLKLAAQPKHLLNAYLRREPDTIDSIKELWNGFTTTIVFFCAYVFTCIIFGAAIVQHFQETICLSILLVACTSLPLCLYLGGTGTWQLLFCDQFELTSEPQIVYLKYIQTNGAACLFGAWISSVVAPLDWDRDWQNYPIPNMCGALLGVMASNIYWLLLATGKHLQRRIIEQRQ